MRGPCSVTRASPSMGRCVLATPRAHVARDHLLAAEGSDWFWWYGDDFATDQKPEFDRLFRARIAAAYAALGLPSPPVLREPILRARALVSAKAPSGAIEPDVSDPAMGGWLGAGRMEIAASRRAMFGGAPRFSALWYGAGQTRAFLRLVPGHAQWAADLDGAMLRVELRGERGAASLSAAIERAPGVSKDVARGVSMGPELSVSMGAALSVAVRVEQAIAAAGEVIEVALLLDVPGAEQERYPASGWLALTRPHPRRDWID